MVMSRWIECRADLLEDGAKTLKLRLKERLRVAVVGYQRRRISRASDGSYFSASVERWINRVTDFRPRSVASTSSFQRKGVSKDFGAEDESSLTRMIQAIAVPVLGNVCHVFMHGFNRIQIFGAERLQDALLHRSKTTPLVTVSNHVASVDDPLVIASLLPPSMMLDASRLRWTLCASDRCFKNSVTSAFFKCVKVLPVSRGDGIYQMGMDLAISKLNCGGWVHIFPEGSRSQDGGKTMGSVKRGIGRLVLDADNLPRVVPFVHTGMQDVMPLGAKFPRIGKTVTILVGEPIEFNDIVNDEAKKTISTGKLYDTVAARIGDHLQVLKLQVEELATHSPETSLSASHRASTILQTVDWEMLGVENFIASNEDNTPGRNLSHDHQTSLLQSNPKKNLGDFSGESPSFTGSRGSVFWTEDVVFGARGLLASYQNYKMEKVEHFGGTSNPLWAWSRLWEHMSETEEPPFSCLSAQSMQQ